MPRHEGNWAIPYPLKESMYSGAKLHGQKPYLKPIYFWVFWKILWNGPTTKVQVVAHRQLNWVYLTSAGQPCRLVGCHHCQLFLIDYSISGKYQEKKKQET